MSTGLRLSAERRRLVEQLGPDNFALLARTLRHQDDAWRLERPGGRGDGQEEPEVPVDVEGDDDVVHACLLGPSAGRVAEFRPRVAPLMRLTYFVHGMVAGGALVAGSFLLGLSGISWAVAAIVIGSVGAEHVAIAIRGLADLEVSTSEATAADPSRSRFSGEVQAGSQTRLRGTAD